MLNNPCRHCGMTVKRAMVLALLEDAGAKVYPSALHCAPKKEHDFSAPRFPVTSCSQCGSDFGPGDSGYSHCDQHAN